MHRFSHAPREKLPRSDEVGLPDEYLPPGSGLVRADRGSLVTLDALARSIEQITSASP
jgi:hypothetical protein